LNERIQKVLARAGVGSRRQVEAWIREGRLAVNGLTASLGVQIGPRDTVTLDGRPLRVRAPDSDTRVVLYHRSPRGALAEGETERATDLTSKLPKRAGRRWISISPLPPNDGGLEVLTSDGNLAQALMRKLQTLPIAFAIRVRGEPTLGQMEYLKSGALDDATLEVESVVPAGGEGANRWLKLLTRGVRARDLHRLCMAAGLELSRVLRVSIGPLSMDRTLGRERTQALSPAETDALYALVGLPHPRALEQTTRSSPGHRKLRPHKKSVKRGGSRNKVRPARPTRDSRKNARPKIREARKPTRRR
jgi:23S rRNA pseudouridine2605 synthase